MPEATNFPDVLGYISGGPRIDYGILQAAAAVRPNPAKAGRPVDVTVVLQNATDSALEVLVVLNVPNRDLAGKGGAFVAKVQRLAIGMQPCEVGVLTLPLLSQPGTAPGVYKFGLQITAKATAGKGSRVRLPEGGGAFYMGGMSRAAQQAIEALKELRYSGASAKRGGLFGGGAPQLEAALILEAGTLGGVLDRKADYQPLWQRRDMKQDPHALLAKHKDALINYVLPSLDRSRLLEPLAKRTMTRFKDSWYELTEIEASMIARVMVRILEYACTGDLSYGRKFLPRPEYEVLPRLGVASNRATRTTGGIPIVKPGTTGTFPVTRTTTTIPIIPPSKQTGGIPIMPMQTGGIPVPGGAPLVKLRWLDELIYVLEDDERAAKFISRFLPERCYDALLRDSLVYAMHEVEAATGMELGTADELEKFADEWMQKLESGAIMTFADIYLPLVLAGIIIHDEVLLPDENLKVLHSQFQHMLEERVDERTDENSALFDMVHTQLDKALRKYGLSL